MWAGLVAGFRRCPLPPAGPARRRAGGGPPPPARGGGPGGRPGGGGGVPRHDEQVVLTDSAIERPTAAPPKIGRASGRERR